MRYNCIYCGELINTVNFLKTHLEKHHPEVNEKDKNEIVSDFFMQNQNLVRIAKLKNEKAIQRAKIENNKIKAKKELSDFKEKIIQVLSEHSVSSKILNGISRSKNLLNAKRLITRSLNKKIKLNLRNMGIDYYAEPKIPKKTIKGKDYSDSTESSIKPIYTPMGNKR